MKVPIVRKLLVAWGFAGLIYFAAFFIADYGQYTQNANRSYIQQSQGFRDHKIHYIGSGIIILFCLSTALALIDGKNPSEQ